MCLNTGTPKNINFSFEINGKLMALGVPILKHFRIALWANSSVYSREAAYSLINRNLLDSPSFS